MFSRPPSSPIIAIRKPSPSPPTMFARRHADAVEDHLPRRLRMPTELLLVRAERHARHVLLDHQARDALRPVLTGADHRHVHLVLARTRDELLRARHDPVVAVANRTRLQCAAASEPDPGSVRQ